ncbi:hypothetical protein XENORESO_021219 [Xenotaenia resolanae]|uniref:Uncharacterized protein n=1 Tax=Xenotaenia resolanae TaxID=208358 RepID=A0ABV0VZ91_9TELE
MFSPVTLASPHSPNIWLLTGLSKLVICPMCLCVVLQWTGDLFRMYPIPLPVTAGDSHQPLSNPARMNRYRQRMDRWMDGSRTDDAGFGCSQTNGLDQMVLY